ncbi:MAG: sugar phosphate isomerase/epimerase [Oscillospiraceae bacterium]|nr:sugar phosphate isomerase/epimerase [Oscillospiraceae bacterium]
MYQFPIGVMLESFRCGEDEALDNAVKVGAKGIQVYVTHGEHSYEVLVGERRAELLKKIKDRGLTISALCGDFGRGLYDPEANVELIEKSKRVLDLAKELGTDVVTTHIGVVPADPNHPRYKIMQEACFELSRYADEMNAHFAIETGPETSAVLKGFLDSLGSRGVAVNFDPANLIAIHHEPAVQAVHNLKDYIVHTHAKDAQWFWQCEPEVIYGIRKPEDIPTSPAYAEVPLGQGEVGFPTYLKALEEVGYKGFLTIEREVGPTPYQDIEMAVGFLKDIISK